MNWFDLRVSGESLEVPTKLSTLDTQTLDVGEVGGVGHVPQANPIAR